MKETVSENMDRKCFVHPPAAILYSLLDHIYLYNALTDYAET